MPKIVGVKKLAESDLINTVEFVDLTKNDNNFTLKFMVVDPENVGDVDKGENREFRESCRTEFNPEDHFTPRSGVELYVIGGSIKFVSTRQQYTVRDGELLSGTTDNSKRLAAIWFCDAPDQHVLILYKQACVSEDLPFEEDSRGFFGPRTIARFYPVMENFAAAAQYRRQILQEFDAHKVLAYLEAQVDLLSVVVQRITESNPELVTSLAKELPLQEIFQAINDSNVTTVKDVEACLDEINTNKKRMRELQKLYIDTKNGRTNG